MICEKCRWKYPDWLVQPLSSNKGMAMVCGICYLEIKNEIHGTNFTSLTGEIAEKMRLAAIEFRKNNQLYAPLKPQGSK